MLSCYGVICNLSRTEVAPIAKFPNISRPLEKVTMETAWVRRGALRAPPRTEGGSIVTFARERKLFVIVAMGAASVHDKSHITQ